MSMAEVQNLADQQDLARVYAPLANCTLLIVDDSYYARYLAQKAIRPLHPKKVLEAVDGSQALSMYFRFTPDLVLIDIIMENTNGLEVLRQLKNDYPEARTLMVSAVDVPEILSECIAIGIHDFVVKPYTQEQLQEAILNALGGE